jgi:type I restriction enzyme S subunit
MTPEVKQRIEQIRQGIVPKGYKKTKTDIVPADWKESPIGEYIREYTEKTTIPNQYPVLTSARTGLMLQTDYYSNRQVTTEDNVGYNILPYGYITFRSRSDDGRFRFNENRIIERGVISYFYPVFSFSEEVCHEYMLYLLNFSIYRRMYPYAEGTAQQVLSLKKLGQLKYSLPLVAEQKKIAEILATQDKAIELQGRKIEELKRFKKGCLEKMFPRKGQKVPEKRFPGFTDDWEQRKLTEFVEFFSGLTYTPNDVQENGTLVLRSSNVSNGEVVDADNVYVNPQVVNSENVKVGDIVVVVRNGSRSLIGKHAQIKAFMPNTVIGAFMTGIRSECPKFTNALLNTSRFEEEIAMNMGATINQITGYMFSKMEFKVPCLDEQKEIGEYFENLDNLITLHQRKLEEMKKQKKALMQLLLTGIVRI